jgi:hypothetical protein
MPTITIFPTITKMFNEFKFRTQWGNVPPRDERGVDELARQETEDDELARQETEDEHQVVEIVAFKPVWVLIRLEFMGDRQYRLIFFDGERIVTAMLHGGREHRPLRLMIDGKKKRLKIGSIVQMEDFEMLYQRLRGKPTAEFTIIIKKVKVMRKDVEMGQLDDFLEGFSQEFHF